MTHNATSATLELDAVNMSPPATSISGSKGVDETSVSNSSKYTYRDFANAVAAPSEENFNPLPASRNNFPVQLHVLLSHAEGEGLLSIVSWKPHGRCFVIHRLHDFEQLVLPRYVVAVVVCRGLVPCG